MKFKDLTQEQISLFQKTYKNKNLSWDQRIDLLKNEFSVSERTIRKWASNKLELSEKIIPEPEALTIAKQKQHDSNKKIFLITWAQNATKVHSAFWNNLKAYADFLDAEILVIPGRYHNLTGIMDNKTKYDSQEWWDTKVVKHLTLNRHNLNNGISILSDVKIQPTASSPLIGLEGMTASHSCVIGHPRLELKTVPVMEGDRPKILFSTGACTIENYSDSKAGKKGEFHHSIGFAIVEIKDNETYFFRQVGAKDNGDFIDLFFCAKNGEISRENSVEACIMGDIHVSDCNPQVTDITLNNLFQKLKPSKVFLHDIMDSKSISHHDDKDPFMLHKKELENTNSLQQELDNMIEWLKPFQEYNTYVVKSNHDIHVDRFLRENDFKKMSTYKNAIIYMELATATLKGEANNGAVPYVINKTYPNIICLTDDDNVKVKGFLCSVHGHMGANGSRGSIQQYSRLSTKIVTGHSHSIGRIGGAVSVGTSTHLRLNYNKSFSAWINAHGIINRFNKFQHIVFFNTKDGLEYTTLYL